MELFKTITYVQNYGQISIERDILKTHPEWSRNFDEIELKNFERLQVNIYYHSYLDLIDNFKNVLFEDYLNEKTKNPYINTKKYIDRKIFTDLKILESILFSRYSQEEHNAQLQRNVSIEHFPKHFVSVSNNLIYTFEKNENRKIDYIFLIGFEDKDEIFQKDYFKYLYKFLNEDIYDVLDALEKLNNNNTEITKPKNQTEKTANPKRLPAPVIIAMLKELGVFGIFNKKGFGRNAIVDTLYQIIGTDKTNLGGYYDSLNSNDQDKFNESHIKKAKDFLNSKGL